MYHEATILHLPRFASDHCPLFLILESYSISKKPPFRVEKIWLNYKRIKDVVNKAWCCKGNYSPGVKLSIFLHKTRRAIMKWKYTI